MNIYAPLPRREPLRLTADGFWMLKQSGAFSAFSKAELIDGALSGVPVQDDSEPESDASIPIRLRRQDYRQLHDAGLLDRYGKTELVDGLLYRMSPQYRRHGFIKDELTFRLRCALKDVAPALYVSTEQSVAIDAVSEPQPDITLTTEPRGDGPIPLASVSLIVEVSVSTLSFNLTEKMRVYAGAGIPEYWIVDVGNRRVHQMWDPIGEDYGNRRITAFDEPVSAATLSGLMIDTADL